MDATRRPAYAGQPEYDFEAALADARRRKKHREQSYRRELEIDDRLYWTKEFPEAATPEALRKHAEKFGPEGVEEVARIYGVDLTATTLAREPKRLSAGKSKRATQRARQALIPEEDLVGAA